MTCTHCGAELPAGAMFCGECGRAVAAASGPSSKSVPSVPPSQRSTPAPVVEDLVEPSGRPLEVPEVAPEQGESRVLRAPELAPRPTHSPPAEPVARDEELSVERCTQCGSALEPSDIFCGECGFVRHNPRSSARGGDTVAYDPFPWGSPRSTATPARASTPSVDPVIDPVVESPAESAPEPATKSSAESAPDAAPAPAAPAAAAGVAAPEADELEADEPDIDMTRIVDRSATGERFVLQFSTGESVSVTGTGLLGRNPVAEPGEYFDVLLPISDPGKSVSKTHLEFGQEGGAFWVSDRFSGNGTVIREPERQPRRCDPGKRYRLMRGSRVDIGEQFFIVS